jgi:hypothetical protein
VNPEVQKGAAFAGERARTTMAELLPDLLDRLWRPIREALTLQHERLDAMSVDNDPAVYAAWKLAESTINDVALDVLNIFRVAKGHEPLELPDGQLVSWQRAGTVEEAH